MHQPSPSTALPESIVFGFQTLVIILVYLSSFYYQFPSFTFASHQ